MRPAISDGIFKLTKAKCHVTHLHGEFENLFVSVAQRLRVFVHNVVGVNKSSPFGKTTFMHKDAIDLRVITIAYSIDQLLLNI